MLRPDRRPRGDDPFLQHKTLIFALGAGCAFAGMYFDTPWLINVGIIVLAVGVVLRLLGERRRERRERDEAAAADDYDDHDDHDHDVGDDDADAGGSSRNDPQQLS